MPDLELTRSPEDRRLYALEGVGTMRLEGLFARGAAAEANGARWRFARRGFGRWFAATDEAGTTVGTFEPRTMRRGGTLHWLGRTFALRPASSWRERYALAVGERELAVLDGKGWGSRPVKVTIAEIAAVEPGLLLFAVFAVRALAEDAQNSAAGASVVVTS